MHRRRPAACAARPAGSGSPPIPRDSGSVPAIRHVVPPAPARPRSPAAPAAWSSGSARSRCLPAPAAPPAHTARPHLRPRPCWHAGVHARCRNRRPPSSATGSAPRPCCCR
ncbi:hypothetical protein G6F63_015452 [Rhizopus arrhizus]|nr:hypothetical protein G6F40_016092 [Rhizopus arrhizus]KAG1317921.1 hypothetical protein G6F63_015452 [Rhizopus arrhizus]